MFAYYIRSVLLLWHILSCMHLLYVHPGQSVCFGEGQQGIPGASRWGRGSVGQLLVSSLLSGRPTETAGARPQGGILYHLMQSSGKLWQKTFLSGNIKWNIHCVVRTGWISQMLRQKVLFFLAGESVLPSVIPLLLRCSHFWDVTRAT